METQPGRRLTPRDKLILQDIHRYQGLDRKQIQLARFGESLSDERQAKRRCQALAELGLIAAAPQLQRDGAGDRPHFYKLTPDGLHLLGDTGRTRELEGSPFFYEHSRTINTLLLAIEAAARSVGWETETQTESQVRALIDKGQPVPDGRFYVLRDGKRRCCLLEYDRGSEYRGKIRNKIALYLDDFGSGRLAKTHGTDAIRVLFVARDRSSPFLTPTPERNVARVQQLLKWIAESTTSAMFELTTEDQFLAANPLTDSIWISVKKPQPHPLLP